MASLSRRRVVEAVVGWLVESEEACCEVSVRQWLASGTVILRRAWEEGGREAFWSRWERIPRSWEVMCVHVAARPSAIIPRPQEAKGEGREETEGGVGLRSRPELIWAAALGGRAAQGVQGPLQVGGTGERRLFPGCPA